MNLEEIYQKLDQDQRISKAEAFFLYQKADWLTLAQKAQARRAQRLGANWASYTLFRVINYTNICNIDCSFCSFKRHEGEQGAYVMSQEEVLAKVKSTLELGVGQIFLQGGVHPDLPFSYYTELLRAIKATYPVHIRGFSPVEIQYMAQLEGRPSLGIIQELKAAGLDSVPGAGAEILVERVRQILSPQKCTVEEWGQILKECHSLGLRGSANLVFGSVETKEEIFEHLDFIRRLQEDTGGFDSFIPWTFQPQTKAFEVQKVPPQEYLKILALCRLFLDNIENIEVSVMVLGKEIGELALGMGANDISSPVIEEKVLRSYGTKSENEAQLLIEDAGYQARYRDFNYQS